MDNSRTFKNYTPEQIDNFLDQIIKQVERMIEDNKAKNKEIALKDQKIEELTKALANTAHTRERLAQYERMESTLNRAVVMAQKTSDQIKSAAHREGEMILEDAKRNADRIINSALIQADNARRDAERLRRNVITFKRLGTLILEAVFKIFERGIF